jgi:hypothetical protein
MLFFQRFGAQFLRFLWGKHVYFFHRVLVLHRSEKRRAIAISNQLPYDKNPFALKLNVPPLPPQIKNLWVVFIIGLHLIFGGEVGL